MPVLSSAADAQTLLNELGTVIKELSRDVESSELCSEDDYLKLIQPKIDEATTKYQTLAAYLQENRKDHDKEYRLMQRTFVSLMQDLQQVQRNAAKRREVLCDHDFVSVSKISAVDLQTAKEEVLEANQISTSAVEVKDLFREVAVIIHQQGQGIDQIERKVDLIRVEIGNGVNELEHARRLQREARKKYVMKACCGMLVMGVIVLIFLLAFRVIT